MRNHSQLSLGPMEGEPLSPKRESDHPAKVEKVSLTDLLAETAEEHGLQEKFTAETMGVDPRYWSRIKSGEKKAHLDPVADLPEHVQRAFLVKWGRMLKMEFTPEDAKRRALAEVARAAISVLEKLA